MKVLVTGANGYIGRHVVVALLDHGVHVIACDLKTEGVDERAERRDVDLFAMPLDRVFQELGAPDVCLHMAWRNGFIHNAPSHVGDLSAHYKLLTAMINGGLRQLAVMGTMHEIGYWEGAIDENTPCNPISMYGIAKDALRRSLLLYTQQNGSCILQWLRCYYIVGDDMKSHSIFGKLLQAAAAGQTTFPFTKGTNKYDFISIDDLAQMIVAVVRQNQVAGVINCCSGHPISLAERVQRFIDENRLDLALDYGAFPDRPYDSPCVYGDDSRIKQIMKHEI